MKHLKHFYAVIIAVMLYSMSACSNQPTQADEPESSAEEVEMLLTIVGNAISDQHEGLLSGIMDLTAQPGEDGLNYLFRTHGEGRGGHDNFVRTYNPETGEHSIRFRRGVDRPNFRSMVRTQLSYIFQDADGGFVARPAQDAGLIETITFSGTRDGFTEGPVRRSQFERTANWVLEGFGPGSDAMQLGGIQQNKGSLRITNREGESVAGRQYNMLFSLNDIQIQKPDASEDRLPFLVTGEIDYEITIRTLRDGEVSTREFGGTLELDGNGQALMRVTGLSQVFRLYLQTGEPAERS
ncbi:hypothetical protein CYPRO_2847 [Cyclonatronum proteinivorum]|uniref:Lipoprotein n=1 Tax=Cyclonatronum proteinivorum TaxID=1457365 RepID=A0A345UNN3_9BACT|nr:hypothetical protein [Cyclonatronum proteinivorum]AXJ02085.1 hypothetical protein CYPRO_2847 [Cyclonatronum proteinivorum]